MTRFVDLARRAYEIRRLSILSTTAAGSGHVTSCMSSADILAVVFFHVMKFDPHYFEDIANDRFILSKGHAAPALYAVWHQLGMVTEAELLQMRSIQSSLEGHPTWRFHYAEAATGSLGMGLSIAAGMALFAQRFSHTYRTYVLLGDSEMSEGSVWEALEFASYEKLKYLTVIVDVNSLGQQGATRYGHNLAILRKRCEAFGWKVFEVDGHSIQDLVHTFDLAKTFNVPVIILAKTIKGYGLSIEGQEGYHGKPLSKEQAKQELINLNNRFASRFKVEVERSLVSSIFDIAEFSKESHDLIKGMLAGVPRYSVSADEEVIKFKDSLQQITAINSVLSPRKAFGLLLPSIVESLETVLVFDAEVSNSTFTDIVKREYPSNFVECYIAEQNMVGMAIGANIRGAKVIVATFAAFLTRAHDQLRMSLLSATSMVIAGTHVGVSIGQDGASQMGLEDIAMFRSMPGAIILYPSDGISAARCLELGVSNASGNVYLRLTRDDLPVLYTAQDQFVIGGSKLLRSNVDDQVLIVTAGITLHESLRAHANLRMKGIHVAIIDAYSIYPLDVKSILNELKRVEFKLLVVEDHYQAGGIGEAVVSALAGVHYRYKHLAVQQVPHSGSLSAVLADNRIDAKSIEDAIIDLVKVVYPA